jgi:hypothetical protein
MNELISPEDQEMIGGPLELETLTDLLRKRISDTGRDIRIGQARTAWKV